MGEHNLFSRMFRYIAQISMLLKNLIHIRLSLKKEPCTSNSKNKEACMRLACLVWNSA